MTAAARWRSTTATAGRPSESSFGAPPATTSRRASSTSLRGARAESDRQRERPRICFMPQPTSVIPPPSNPSLSASQLATLAEHGEERTAGLGDVLYHVGDRRYPFIAILEGEVVILDRDGNEIVRHGASSFLGELNLLSGQTVFVSAVVVQPLRY